MSSGIIYIFTNKAMPDFVKIGRTSTGVDQRMKELDKTGIPLPFECYYAAEVEDYEKVESLIHSIFQDRRVRKNREFFKVDPERIVAAIKLVQIKDVTPERDDEVEGDTDLEEFIQRGTRQANLTFDMLGIPKGTILTFLNHPDITCEVIDEKKVKFRDRVLSVSQAALIVRREQGYTCQTLNGWTYWTIENRILSDFRDSEEEAA